MRRSYVVAVEQRETVFYLSTCEYFLEINLDIDEVKVRCLSFVLVPVVEYNYAIRWKVVLGAGFELCPGGGMHVI